MPSQGPRRRPISSAALTRRTSLTLPTDMPIGEWQRVGSQIFAMSDSSTWWLGDWLVYGQTYFPNRYQRAVEETGFDHQTLRNYAWVARQFAMGRRRSALSFQHHAELASLGDEEQERWMDRAVRLRWSRSELRRELRAHRTKGSTGEIADACQTLRIRLNVPEERRRRWQDAAATAEQDLIEWMVAILDAATSCARDRSRPLLQTSM